MMGVVSDRGVSDGQLIKIGDLASNINSEPPRC